MKKFFYKNFFENWQSYGIILCGTVLMAASLDMFLVPNKIAAGGVSGIATVIYHIYNIPVGLSVIAMNIPLFIGGTLCFGYRFAWKTLISTLLFSAFIDVLVFLPVPTKDPVLAAIYGGALMGAGLGLVFQNGATTGGSDITAALMKHFFPRFTIGQYIYGFDIFVVILAGTVFKDYDLSLYSLASIYISAKIIDGMLEGVNFAKTVFIISSKPDKIATDILYTLHKGVTALYGQGMYTGEQKKVIICVVKRELIANIKQIVKQHDPYAFVFLSDVREVFGEGFET